MADASPGKEGYSSGVGHIEEYHGTCSHFSRQTIVCL